MTTSGNAEYIYDYLSNDMIRYTNDKEIIYSRNFENEENLSRANCIVYILKRSRNNPQQTVFFGAVTRTAPNDTMEKGYVRVYDVACKS